jgi:hypothetical protein
MFASSFRRSVSALAAALFATLATFAILASTPAQAQAQSQAQPQRAACRTIQVTGQNVGLREFPYNNADVLRAFTTGTLLRSCQFLRGGGANGYTPKCGQGGHNWYRVIQSTDPNGVVRTINGWVPATCVR